MAIGGIGGNITNFNQQAVDQQTMIHNQVLARGVRNGSLNKDEFLDLNKDLNDVEQLRDTFQQDGISKEEQAILDSKQLAYAAKLDQFRGGDFKPAVVGGNPYDKAQNEQAGQIFDGIKEGTIDNQESIQLLGMQRNMARGSLQRNPNEEQQKLDESAFEIQLARKSSQPAPAQQPKPEPFPKPFPGPFPMPTPGFGGFGGGGFLPNWNRGLENQSPGVLR